MACMDSIGLAVAQPGRRNGSTDAPGCAVAGGAVAGGTGIIWVCHTHVHAYAAGSPSSQADPDVDAGHARASACAHARADQGSSDSRGAVARRHAGRHRSSGLPGI